MFFFALSAMAFAAATPVGLPTTGTTPVYVDVVDYRGPGGGWGFLDLEDRLAKGFDDVCGDTFCEGEYSNIQHLRYRCSVRAADGVMGECIWTLAGSNQAVDQTSGKVVVNGHIWQCRSPIVPGTTLGEFNQALEGRKAIDAPLPRGGMSIYEGLIDCGF